MALRTWPDRVCARFDNGGSTWRSVVLVGAGLAGTAAVVLVAKKLLHKRKLNVSNWEKDKVYLCGFPRVSSGMMQLSPFVLKLEAWLRMNNISYEYVVSMQPSTKGQWPYIELNGEEIADSNLVIQHLSKKLNVQIDKSLTLEQQGVAHAFSYLAEKNLVMVYAYHRYVMENAAFMPFIVDNFKNILPLMMRIPGSRYLMLRGAKKNLRLQGIGRNTDEEIINIGTRDLQAINDFLGKKQFMMGDKTSTVDAYIFAHVAQIQYYPFDNNPLRDYMVEKTPALMAYVDRVKKTVYPDWDSLMANAAQGKQLTRG